MTRGRRLNAPATLVALITAIMAVVYVLLVRSQGNSPRVWVLAAFALAVALAAYASSPRADLGPAALAVTGLLLVVIGVLGIFSIGPPLLVAGVIATVSGWRRLANH